MHFCIRYVALPIICALTATHVCAQSTVEIIINDVKSSQGELRVGLFDEKDFLKNVVEGKIVKPTKGSVTVVFESVKPGTYAISVLHDENENGILDRTKLGIPKEGFAFGNNAMGKKGPPTFDQAKIEIGDNPVKQVLKMKYF